jgi:hypothetical protein
LTVFHDADSLSLELQRLQNRPPSSDAPPVLSVFDVTTAGDPAIYLERLRAPIEVGLKLGITEEFSDDALPVEELPDWFIDVSGDRFERAPAFAQYGRECYLELRGSGNWRVQGWLFRFAPDDETRGWAWWDATIVGKSEARIWVDSWGESFFGCGDLRWVAFTAGAKDVAGPRLARPEEWAAEVSGRP